MNSFNLFLKNYKNNLLNVFFILIIPAISFSQVERLSDNTFFTDSTFSTLCNGEYTWSYENQQLGERANYTNGKVNGLYELYNENGTLNYKANYLNGEVNGLSTWYYKNGEIHFQSNYEHDLLNGESIYYDKSGNIELKEF